MNPIKQNIGTLDRYLRLSAGLIIFGSAVTGRRSPVSRSLLTALGAAKIAEGITGWCPLIALTGGFTPTAEQNTDSNSRKHKDQADTAESDKTGSLSSLDQSDRLHSQQSNSQQEAGDKQTTIQQTDARRNASRETVSGSDFSSALDELELQHAADDSRSKLDTRNEALSEDEFDDDDSFASNDADESTYTEALTQ